MTRPTDPARDWWKRRRLPYNLCLVGSIFVGFVAYQVILHTFKTTIGQPYVNPDGSPTGVYDIDVDDAPFGACAGLCAASIVVLLANLFYSLGPALERFLRATVIPLYRPLAWWAGTLLSCAPPLAIPALHLVLCLFFPNAYDHTPILWPDVTTPTTAPTPAAATAPTTQP